MMFEVAKYIPGRDSLGNPGAQNPYRVAWEAGARLPVAQAIDEVARVCHITYSQASLLVFCELRESQPLEPSF